MFERNSFSPDEPENNWIRRALAKSPPVIQDPESIWSAYHVEQGYRQRYYYTDERKTQLAITATHDAIKTKRHDAKTVSAMVDLAEARGWKTVRARGPKEFRREAWIQARVKGNVAVTGYWETSADMREVARRRTQAQESKQAAPSAAITSNHVARNPEIAALVKRIDHLVSAAERAASPGQASNRTERKTEPTKDILGELTPAERVRLNAPPDNVDRAERMAERMADATDRMHDAARERQADNHKPLSQAERDAGRARAKASPRDDRQAAQRASQAASASSRTSEASA